jgi:hypothetical protein
VQDHAAPLSSLFEDLRSKYKNLSNDDLMNVFSWRVEQNRPDISKTDLNQFVGAQNEAWNELGNCQVIKLKSRYTPGEHDVVNQVDKERCYTAFRELSGKYTRRGGDGEYYLALPKGVTEKQAQKEIHAFVRNETQKNGFEFRWDQPMQNKIGGLSQYLDGGGEFHPLHYRRLVNAFANDEGYKNWEGNNSGQTSGEWDKIAAAPGKTDRPAFPLAFRDELVKLLYIHEEKTKQNGKQYFPAEKGLPFVRELIIFQVARDGAKNMSAEETDAFRNLNSALQDEVETGNFDMEAWNKFKAVMLKNDGVTEGLQQYRNQK